MPIEKMTPVEKCAVLSLAMIMSLRMVGLFMVLPVFTLYAIQLLDATPMLMGLAVGVYGFTQGVLQLPFGLFSDHVGRKKIIALGLGIFILGSALATYTHTIWGMILARALQGAGAVGSTIMAFIADLTRETQRTKAMAIAGITIGGSFSLAMILGPLLSTTMPVNDLFGLAALFGILALIILFTWVPTPTAPINFARSPLFSTQILPLFVHPTLLQLNIGIFILHTIFTANMIALPLSLQTVAHLSGAHQWIVFLPALVFALFLTFPLITIAEKKYRLKKIFLLAIGLLGLAELLFYWVGNNLLLSMLGLLLFFTGFSLLEAFLPSLISKTAPAHRKGAALGIYSSSQFLGIFVGGVLGGWLYGDFNLATVYLFCSALVIIWLGIAFTMKNPQHQTF